MSGLTYEEYSGWRNRVQAFFRGIGNQDVEIFNPVTYYSYEEKCHKTDKEVMRYELNQITKCDVILVNLDKINESVGSIVEVYEAYKRGKSIIAFGKTDGVHPWILEMIDRVDDSLLESLDYIIMYLLYAYKGV